MQSKKFTVVEGFVMSNGKICLETEITLYFLGGLTWLSLYGLPRKEPKSNPLA